MERSPGTIDEKLCRILFSYRTTPHPTTGETPSMLLMKRELRTRFSDIRPSLDQQKDFDTFDNNAQCVQKYKTGDNVFVKNLRSGPRWLPGIITEVLQRAYYVQVGDAVWKRHEDQLRPRVIECRDTGSDVKDIVDRQLQQNRQEDCSRHTDAENVRSEHDSTTLPEATASPEINDADLPAGTTSPVSSVPAERRYPVRERKVPQRYGVD